MYTLQAVERTGAAAFVINQVQSQDLDSGMERYVAGGNSSINNAFAAIIAQKPTLGVVTTAIKTALTNIGIGGAAIATATPLLFYFMRREPGAVYASTLHEKITAYAGIIVPNRLTASQGQAATIEYQCTFLTDGTNAPLTMATTSTLATDSDADQGFTLGPVTIGGVPLNVDALQELTIDFGYSLDVIMGGGKVWPSQVSIKQETPTITVATLDMSDIRTHCGANLMGKAASAVFWLRQMQHGSGTWADASAKHISMSAAADQLNMEQVSVSDRENAQPAIVFTPLKSGANAILAILTDQVIA